MAAEHRRKCGFSDQRFRRIGFCISIDPAVCHGRPVIRGTRVPVAVITGGLAGGMSLEQVAAEYDVSREDIQAALAYVTELVETERHLPLAG